MMKNLVLALAVMLFGYTASAQDTKALLDSYLKVKNALVKSDSKAASEAVAAFSKKISGEKDFAQKATLLKSVEKMNKAANLEKQRAAFNDVSVQMWKLVQNTAQVDEPVYYQYCPMKKPIG